MTQTTTPDRSPTTALGRYIMRQRALKRITLFDAYRGTGLRPERWSEIERGEGPPPSERELFAIGLGLGLADRELDALFDVALLSWLARAEDLKLGRR
jgi:hypothetical protein